MIRVVAVCLITVGLAACEPVAEPAVPSEPASPVPPAPVAVSAADAAWQGEVDRFLGVNVQPSEPVDAVVWRSVRCAFLAGKAGGDNAAQDQAIRSRIDELRCGDALTGEIRELRRTLAGDPASVARLDLMLAPR